MTTDLIKLIEFTNELVEDVEAFQKSQAGRATATMEKIALRLVLFNEVKDELTALLNEKPDGTIDERAYNQLTNWRALMCDLTIAMLFR